MIIFQTAGGSSGGITLGGAILGDRDRASATTFRNNDYIHRLNRTLQAEMRAISAYQSLPHGSGGASVIGDMGDKAFTAHQMAGKQLVCLIIASRGVPEDRSALSLGFTKTFIQICSAIPSRLFERATASTLLTLERQLVQSYLRLLKEAPARDAGILKDLRVLTERRAAELTAMLL